MANRRVHAALLALVCGAAVSAATVSKGLQARLAAVKGDARVPVIIYLKPPAPLATSFPNAATAMRRLRGLAHRSQRALLAWLSTTGARNVRSLWVVNAIAVEAPPSLIRRFVHRTDVDRIEWDGDGGADSMAPSDGVAAAGWNIARIRADQLWPKGIDGRGVRVGVIDTGIDAGHPDLRGRLARNGWFDAVNGRPIAYDDGGHGTMVAGLIAAGHGIGVAPGAELLVAKALDAHDRFRTSWLLAAGQWMADPNGDGDPSDAPGIVNASWSFSDPRCLDFRPVLALWKMEHIWPVFPAGNAGPAPGTVAAPGNDPWAVSVGASDRGDLVPEFSGRGPSTWTQQRKPDVVAPGVFICSTKRGGGYDIRGGTSFASPQVAGTLALLRQMNPKMRWMEALERLHAASGKLSGVPTSAQGYGRLDVPALLKKGEQ